MKINSLNLFILLALFTITYPQIAAADKKTNALNIHQDIFEHPFEENLFKKYMNSLPKDGLYFIVEGDMLYTEQELRAYVVAKSYAEKHIGPELIVNVNAGKLDYWKDLADRKLTYAVDRNSFPNEEWYNIIVTNMKEATKEWQDACLDCKVTFTHLIEHDSDPSHDSVTFILRYNDTGGKYIAAAFFPYYSQLRRYINIDPSYFSTRFDKIGVLRHELGHILGYRHEHIRGIPGCYSEGNQWHPLTPYDAKSVMHYFCGRGGTLNFQITNLDKAGHRKLYELFLD